MENRILTLKRTLLAFFTLLLFAQVGWSQHFIFDYSGPTTISVDGACEGILDWGAFTPTVSTVGGQAITFFDINNISGGYMVGDLVPPGVQVVVTYLAIDDLGNDSLFVFSIDFEDNMAPMIDVASVPADITVSCAVPVPPVVNATDNCDGTFATTVIDVPATIDYCTGGVIVRIFSATDVSGNISIETQNISVLTNGGPSISGGFLASIADITVSCDMIPAAPTLTAADILDDCTLPANVTIVDNGLENIIGGQTCPTTQLITRTWTLEDDCGLQFNITQNINVEDNSAPVITPPAVTSLTIQCTGVPSDPETQILNYEGNFTVTDNCSPIVWSNDYTGLTGGACAGTGTASVIYTATDGCNSTSVTINFIVQDSESPNIVTVAQNEQVACDGTGNAADLTAWLNADGNAVLMDACSPSNLIVKTFAVPSDLTTDDPFVALTNAIAAAGCVATITVEFTFMDDCGNNMSTTAADFSIIDNVDPTIPIPASNEIVECDGIGNGTDLANWLAANGNAVGSDVCSGTTVTWRIDPAMPTITNTCGNEGAVTVDFYVSDECGNENPVPTTATFTIEDTIDPTWTISPIPLTIECDGTVDPGGQIATWIGNNGNGSATDGCNPGLVTYTHNYTVISDECGESGSVNVMFTAHDGCGNSETMTAILTVEDTTAPMVTAPADVTVECDMVPVPGTPTVTDMCDMNPVIVFTTNTVPGACANEAVITRTWTATDALWKYGMDDQVITVQDNIFPTVTGTLPADVTVECNAIPAVPIAGTDIVGADNCGLASFDYLQISTQGTDTDLCSFYNYTLTRTWTAIDECGNTTVHTQVIIVEDNNDPTMVRPVNLTVNCENVNNFAVTGQPTNVSDGCDNSPEVTFVDNITVPGSCPFNYTLERTWTITDGCGNSFSDVQTIFVQDVTDPIFGNTPQSMTMVCTDNMTADAAYANWLATNGGGAATDNCGTITWYDLEPGSYDINDEATFTTFENGLDAAGCPSPTMGIYRTNDVSFVAVDQCGNAIEQTVTFTVTDNTPPVFADCPVDVTFENDPGICGVNYALNPPLIIDECSSNTSNVNVTVMEPFVSPNPGDDQTIVNPITLDIGPLPINPVVATDPVTLTIDLNNYDGEDTNEFFEILGEDGMNLGQTNNSATQCGNSTTTITLSASQLNDWASIDGFVTITLLPNVTVDPIFAINDICPQGPPTGGGSTAVANIDYTSVSPNGLTYEYRIDNGSRVQVTPGTVVPYTFDVGTTLVTYFATDCAGNESSCSYSVIVEDNELPTMACPSDFTVSVPANVDCSVGASVDLVPPTNIFDNCGFQNMFSQVQPQNFNQSLLTFTYNPNYLDYVADDKSFSFFGTGANAVSGFVTFTVRVEGDVEDADEYFEIYGEDGSLIGTTQAGQSNVNITTGVCPTLSISVTTISVPVAIFNAWALDGQVDITAVSNSTFGLPPPGTTGDGISPACTVFPGGTPDGTADGVSNLTVVLDYTSVAPTYFATGATTIGNSIFPVPLVPVTHNLNIGVTTVTYQIEDVNGNVNTCTYDITVEDNIAPMAVCQGITLYVTPDGSVYTLDPTEIDNGSSDNCGIASMTVSPNTFDCSDVGSTVNVTLEVTDDEGNTSSCIAPVNIQTIEFFPSFSIGLCGNTDLNLFANAPVGMYSIEWSGPNGFVSFDENPVIPNAAASYSGTFVVTITGQGGCEATGAVTLTINSSPNTPITTIADNDICTTEDIVIETQSYSGTMVTYSWYEGVSPTGTLLGTTQIPNYTILNPATGIYSYYVIVDVDACQTNPSGAVSAEVSDSPVIITITNTVIDCATGDEDMILTPTVTPASTNYLYEWVGPNGFYSTSMNATLPDVSSADNGSYTLVVSNGSGGCQSNPYTHVISVDDLPQTPIITSLDNQLCEGDLLQLQLVNNPYVGANITYNWTLPNATTVTTSVASFTINTATVTDAGNYVLSVTVDGCTSNTSGMFAVNVNSIPSAPVASYNGPVCEGTTLQLMTDFVPGASYFWTGPNNFNSTNQSPLVFPADQTDEGTYFVSIVVNGCPSASSAPLLVEVNDAPDAVLAASNGPICLGDPNAILELSVASASAIPGATYTWYQASTNTIVGGPTTSLITTVSDLTPFSTGSNDFYVVANINSCPSTASVPTAVNFDNIPTNGAFAGNDIFVCDNNSVVLNAQTPTVGTGQWIQTSGSAVVIANPNQSTTSIVGLTSGQSYTFAWTLSNGACVDYATDDVLVTVDIAIATADAGVDFQLCNATETNLNATPVTGGITGTWTQPSSQALLGITIVNPTDPNTQITGLMPGNNYQFIWTLSNAGCGNFSSDIIVVTDESTVGIEAFAGNEIDLCGNEETPLAATPAPIGSTGIWTTAGGTIIISPSQPNTFVTDLEPGANTFTWTLSNVICGEYSSDEVTVFYEPRPTANDDFYDISYNGSLDLDVLTNDDIIGEYTISYTNPTNGTITEADGVFSYASNLVYVGVDEFIYEICSDICPDECSTATVTLTVGGDATCKIPTIFSPNNDGINDEFIVPCLSTDKFPNNVVSIFNQWGDEVYRQAQYQNNWQGTYKGENLPTGTYFWVIDFGDGITPTSGFLVLER